MEDLISCTKETPEGVYYSLDIAAREGVKDVKDIELPRVAEALEQMKYFSGPSGIDGLLDNANSDAIVYLPICSSDVLGLVRYPVIWVPLGFMPKDMSVHINFCWDLMEDRPGIP